MLHWPITVHSMEHFTSDSTVLENPPSVETAFQTLVELQDEGKIHYIGISNHGIEQTQEVLATGAKIIVNEVPYNLVSRAIEQEIMPFCAEQEIGIFGYMALQQGLLAGIMKRPKIFRLPKPIPGIFITPVGRIFSPWGRRVRNGIIRRIGIDQRHCPA